MAGAIAAHAERREAGLERPIGQGLVSAARSGLGSGDVDEERRAAHTLKSNAATFGACELAERSRRLEEDAKAGTISDGANQIGALAEELECVREALPVATAALAEHP